jgi:DNA-binding LytR/AlgR family response regulator
VTDIDHGNGAGIEAPREARFRVIDAERIAVCWGSSTELLAWSEIVSVHSLRNCAVITACGRTVKVRSTLRAVVAELACLGLMQVRRDTAVNITRVRRLIGAGRHRLLMILDDDRHVEVGREFQRQVRARFASS